MRLLIVASDEELETTTTGKLVKREKGLYSIILSTWEGKQPKQGKL